MANKGIRTFLRGLLTTAAIGWSLPLVAQVPSSQGSSSDPSNPQAQDATSETAPQLTDIVVTAQRRSQNLQSVPISVVAFGSDSLQKAGINNGEDLAKAVPALQIDRGTGATLIFLRGIGASSAAAGNEASNAVYIDGIYYARFAPSFLEFNNIDHVEVLKGPQGTLFGRNATGGLIQVITRTPTADPVFKGSIGYENYERVIGQAYVAGGIAEGVAADLAVTYSDQHKGWGRNVTTGNDVNKDKNFALRSKIVMDPTDTTQVTVIGQYNKASDNKSIPSAPFRGTTQGTNPPLSPQIFGPLPGFYDVRNDPDNLQKTKSYGGSIKIEQDLSFAKLVSTSAYLKSQLNTANYDVDFIPQDYFHAKFNEHVRQTSQEFQLISPSDKKFNWIVGAFYLNTKDGYPEGLLAGSQFGGLEVRFVSQQRVKSLAGYAQATVEVVENTSITAGLRYTRDRVNITGTTDVAVPGGPVVAAASPPVDDTSVFNKLTWKAAIDHRFSPDILAYLSASRGYKAGTYGTIPAVTVVAKPEVLDAYEAGLKTELFDRRVRINLAAFYYDLKDPQVEIIRGPSQVTVNAGGAHVKGVDLDFDIAATRQLSIRGGAAILDGRYTDFQGAPFGAPSPGPNGGTLPLVGIDASHTRMQRAPKFTANLSPTYTIATDSGIWTLSGSVSYNSGFYWQPGRQNWEKSRTLVNGQLSYSFSDKRYAIRVYGKNLTDVKYYSSVYLAGGTSGTPSTPAAPRTYGVAFDFNF